MIRKKESYLEKHFALVTNLNMEKSIRNTKRYASRKDKVVIIDDIFATSGTIQASLN